MQLQPAPAAPARRPAPSAAWRGAAHPARRPATQSWPPTPCLRGERLTAAGMARGDTSAVPRAAALAPAQLMLATTPPLPCRHTMVQEGGRERGVQVYLVVGDHQRDGQRHEDIAARGAEQEGGGGRRVGGGSRVQAALQPIMAPRQWRRPLPCSLPPALTARWRCPAIPRCPRAGRGPGPWPPRRRWPLRGGRRAEEQGGWVGGWVGEPERRPDAGRCRRAGGHERAPGDGARARRLRRTVVEAHKGEEDDGGARKHAVGAVRREGRQVGGPGPRQAGAQHEHDGRDVEAGHHCRRGGRARGEEGSGGCVRGCARAAARPRSRAAEHPERTRGAAASESTSASLPARRPTRLAGDRRCAGGGQPAHPC